MTGQSRELDCAVAMENLKTILLPKFCALNDGERLAGARMFVDEMATRRIVRDFCSKFLSRAVIEACINIVSTAPSVANQQPWHFVAIFKPQVKSRIREAAEKEKCAFYEHCAPDECLQVLPAL